MLQGSNMSVSKEQVLAELSRVKGPDLEGNIVALGLVSEVLIRDNRVYFSITVPASRAEELEPLRQAAEKVVRELAGVAGVTAVLTADRAPQAGRTGQAPGGAAPEHARVQAARARGAAGDGAHRHDHGNGHAHGPGGHGQPARAPGGVPGVKHMVAVASGKGGVGKSTTAVNLALGLRAIGLKTGILDADIYGPSQPKLLGLTGRPQTADGTKLRPMEGYGLKCMSMGFLVEESTPIIWRGPMVVGALNQMLREVLWGELDVLVIDMPPGTGDVQLTMAQQVPLSGAIIVSTPQDLALIDARKGLNMFKKVDVPVLGIIENMSYFTCTKCGEMHEIFGHGGAREEAERMEVAFLGEVPLDIDVRMRSDSGRPIVATRPESAHAAIYREMAAKVWAALSEGAGRRPPPRIVFE
jgi:ATP-binding protein involved in chromosome partitioning